MRVSAARRRIAGAGLVALALGASRLPAQAAPPCTDVATAPVAHEGPWPDPLATPVSFRARGIALRDALDQLASR